MSKPTAVKCKGHKNESSLEKKYKLLQKGSDRDWKILFLCQCSSRARMTHNLSAENSVGLYQTGRRNCGNAQLGPQNRITEGKLDLSMGIIGRLRNAVAPKV